MSKNGNRRSYDRAFKVEAVRLVTEEKRRATEVTRELGVHSNQLHRWKRKLAEEGEFVFPGKGRLSPKQEELRRLRRESADLHEERDILKKPARGGPSSRAAVGKVSVPLGSSEVVSDTEAVQARP